MTAQYLVPGDAEEEGVHQGAGEQEPGDAGTHGGGGCCDVRRWDTGRRQVSVYLVEEREDSGKDRARLFRC